MRRILFTIPVVTTFACRHDPPAVATIPAGDWHLPPLPRSDAVTSQSQPAESPASDSPPPPSSAPPTNADRFSDPTTWVGVSYGTLAPLQHPHCPPNTYCNPPRPSPTGDPPTRTPRAIALEPPHGSRVRLEIVDLAMTTHWRAHVVDAHGTPLAHSRCKIVDVGLAEFDCTTHLPPRALINSADGTPLSLVIERPSPTPEPPDPDEPTPPARARIVHYEPDASGVLVTISVGSEHGLTRTARIRIDHAPCQIVRVERTQTQCLVHLSPDQVDAHREVAIELAD